MKKHWYQISITTLALAICVNFYSCSEDKERVQEFKEALIKNAERGYFQGQVAAINGDIRVRLVEQLGCTTYVWIKSPWDNGSEPIFHPECAVDTIKYNIFKYKNFLPQK